jgi:hypothetical protein
MGRQGWVENGINTTCSRFWKRAYLAVERRFEARQALTSHGATHIQEIDRRCGSAQLGLIGCEHRIDDRQVVRKRQLDDR